MTSISAPFVYDDKIEIDDINDDNLTIEQEPLAIVVEIAMGIQKKPYWERDYKAYWKIANSKLYLKKIHSNYINDDTFSMKNFFSMHIDKFGEHEPVFADWYSGKLIVAINEETHRCENDLYIFTTYREITIMNGNITHQNEIYAGYKELPF
jgi:hypothetical protein